MVITKAHQFIPIQQISPHILGGLIVEIGDRTIDYSVSSKITKLNKMLTDVV
jgi:F-type H+-transporting ATPase subunit O